MILLAWFWKYKLNKLKKQTGFVAVHAYPPDPPQLATWRKYRAEYYSILAFEKITRNRDAFFK